MALVPPVEPGVPPPQNPAGADRLPVDAVISTAPAGLQQQRLAAVIVSLSLIVFGVLAPYAAVPLAVLQAFIPAYEAALIIIDVITAVLLFGQFTQRGSPALLVLAAGYLFDGV